LNEEVNIEGCLESCAWCDDVHVLDSGSTDRTVEIARSMGAQVHTHPFESFGAQRNWAIDNIRTKHDWIFHLDADERFTPALVEEMARALEREPAAAGFHVPSKLIFMGRWLKRAGGYPTYQMRLFHKERMRFRDYGHGQREATEGVVATLHEPYIHFPFSKGLEEWYDKHNRYSTLEARELLASRRERIGVGALWSFDPVARRRAWKVLGYRLPWRPAARWAATMVLQGGVLEGRPAWLYASLLASYERMISQKVRILRRGGFEDVRAVERVVASPQRRYTPERLDGEAVARPVVQPREDAAGQMIPEASPWTFREKVARALWMLVGRPIFRLSFHNWYGFRAWLLRRFGAKVGKGTRIRPTVNIEIPWHVEIGDGVTIGDYAILYSLGRIRIGDRAILSQYSHLCAG
ncbi:MAG: glycosyltransferase, partial [Planctomycetota bacterium]